MSTPVNGKKWQYIFLRFGERGKVREDCDGLSRCWRAFACICFVGSRGKFGWPVTGDRLSNLMTINIDAKMTPLDRKLIRTILVLTPAWKC